MVGNSITPLPTNIHIHHVHAAVRTQGAVERSVFSIWSGAISVHIRSANTTIMQVSKCRLQSIALTGCLSMYAYKKPMQLQTFFLGSAIHDNDIGDDVLVVTKKHGTKSKNTLQA